MLDSLQVLLAKIIMCPFSLLYRAHEASLPSLSCPIMLQENSDLSLNSTFSPYIYITHLPLLSLFIHPSLSCVSIIQQYNAATSTLTLGAISAKLLLVIFAMSFAGSAVDCC